MGPSLDHNYVLLFYAPFVLKSGRMKSLVFSIILEQALTAIRSKRLMRQPRDGLDQVGKTCSGANNSGFLDRMRWKLGSRNWSSFSLRVNHTTSSLLALFFNQKALKGQTVKLKLNSPKQNFMGSAPASKAPTVVICGTVEKKVPLNHAVMT